MASMFRITTNAKEYLAALASIPKAMQQVTAATLTDTAEAVTKRSERNIKRMMIVRTPYTLKSLKTYKASASRPIARQDAVSGTTSDYLPLQDAGATIRAKKRAIPIPTNRVRGADRKRKIPGAYRLNRSGEIQWKRPYAKGARFFALYPTTADIKDEKNWGRKKSRSKKWRVKGDKIFGRNRGSKGHAAFRLSRPAIFERRGRKLVKVRDVGQKRIHLKAREWHTEAVKTYGNYEYMARMFQLNAAKFLGVPRPGLD